jgi:hypothetical protein
MPHKAGATERAQGVPEGAFIYLMAGVAAAAFNLSHSHAAMLLTQRPKEGPLAKMHPKRGQGTSPWPACSAPISFANDDLPGRGPQLVTARGRGDR